MVALMSQSPPESLRKVIVVRANCVAMPRHTSIRIGSHRGSVTSNASPSVVSAFRVLMFTSHAQLVCMGMGTTGATGAQSVGIKLGRHIPQTVATCIAGGGCGEEPPVAAAFYPDPHKTHWFHS